MNERVLGLSGIVTLSTSGDTFGASGNTLDKRRRLGASGYKLSKLSVCFFEAAICTNSSFVM